MSANSQKRIIRSMNLDDDLRDLKQGETRENLNARIGSATGSESGSVNLAYGTRKVIIPNDLPGEKKVIGEEYSDLLKKKYSLIYNALGYHLITESDLEGNVTILMIDIISTNQVPLLKFKKDSLILHINIIQTSFENPEYILTWTEFSNPQRKLNITKLKNGDYGPFITEEDISVAKTPHLYTIPLNFESDFTSNFNFLKGSPLPQMMIQYIFDDNEKSAWSPITSLTKESDLPRRDELYMLQKNGSVEWLYNRVKCKIPLGHDRVKRVLVGARFKDNGIFKLVGEIDKSKQPIKQYGVSILSFLIDENGLLKDTNYIIKFNSEELSFVTSGAASKSYLQLITEFANYIRLSIPPEYIVEVVDTGQDQNAYFTITGPGNFTITGITDTLGVIKKQDVPLNNFIDFYFYNNGSYITIDNETALKPYDAIPFNSGGQELVANNVMLYVDNLEGWDNVPVNLKINLAFNNPLDFLPLNKIDVVAFPNGNYALNFYAYYSKGEIVHIKYKTSGVGIDKAVYNYAYEVPFDMNGVTLAKLIAGELAMYITSKQDISYISLNSRFITIGSFTELPEVKIYPPTKTQRVVKRNGVYQYGICYFEGKKRASNIQTNEAAKIFIPSVNDSAQKGIPVVSWEVSHRPPERATGYSWYRTKNLAFQYFRQYFVGNTSRVGSSIILDLTNILNFSNGNSKFPAYTFEQGDRIRLISTPQKAGECQVRPNPGYTINGEVNSSIRGIGGVVPFPIEDSDFSKSWNGSFYRAKTQGTFRFNLAIEYKITLNLTAVNVILFIMLRNRKTGVTTTLQTDYFNSGPEFTNLHNLTIDKNLNIGDEYDIFIAVDCLIGVGQVYVEILGQTILKVSNLSEQTDSSYPQTIDLPIEQADGLKLTIAETSESITAGTFVEIYRPTQELISDLNTFAEISEIFPIINPGTEQRMHGGQTQNQTESLPATGTFSGGDVWLKVSEMPKYGSNQPEDGWNEEAFYALTPVTSIIYYKNRYWASLQDSNQNHDPVDSPDWWREVLPEKVVHESSSFSYLYDGENSSDMGRVEAINPNANIQRIRNGIRYSLPYIQGTLENGLSTFPLDQNRVYENMYGGFQRIHYKNNRLQVMLDNKAGQILINERILLSNTGERTVAQSDALLNNFIPFEGEFGIGNQPSSYATYDNFTFFVDPYRSALCTIAGNTIIDISVKGKVKSEILKLCQYLRNFGGTVYSGIDIENSEWLITFNFIDGTESKTLAFNFQEQGGFTTFYQFKPHFYSRCGTKLTSCFLDSDENILHIHDSPLMNNFYGTQYKTSIKPVFNEYPTSRKIFLNIVLKAKSLWTVPEIVIPENEEYPTGMFSRLTKTRFNRTEGDYFASFLRDINTPGFDSEVDKLFYGRKLRGDVMVVKLESDSTKDTSIYSAEVQFDISQQTT